MLRRSFLLFVLLPLLELGLLIQTGRWIGLWPTLGLVVGTGLLGVLLARSEGFRVLGDLQIRLLRGEMPGGALLDGASVLLGGVLLVAPGIITDLLGFSLILPPTRRLIQSVFLNRFRRRVERGEVQVTVLRSRPLERGEDPPSPDAHR